MQTSFDTQARSGRQIGDSVKSDLQNVDETPASRSYNFAGIPPGDPSHVLQSRARCPDSDAGRTRCDGLGRAIRIDRAQRLKALQSYVLLTRETTRENRPHRIQQGVAEVPVAVVPDDDCERTKKNNTGN